MFYKCKGVLVHYDPSLANVKPGVAIRPKWPKGQVAKGPGNSGFAILLWYLHSLSLELKTHALVWWSKKAPENIFKLMK